MILIQTMITEMCLPIHPLRNLINCSNLRRSLKIVGKLRNIGLEDSNTKMCKNINILLTMKRKILTCPKTIIHIRMRTLIKRLKIEFIKKLRKLMMTTVTIKKKQVTDMMRMILSVMNTILKIQEAIQSHINIPMKIHIKAVKARNLIIDHGEEKIIINVKENNNTNPNQRRGNRRKNKSR